MAILLRDKNVVYRPGSKIPIRQSREKVLSASRNSLDCFFSRNIVNVEAINDNLNVDAEWVRKYPVGIHVSLLLVPLSIDFIFVGSLVFMLLIRIRTVLGDEEVIPQLLTSQSRRLGDVQLLG